MKVGGARILALTANLQWRQCIHQATELFPYIVSVGTKQLSEVRVLLVLFCREVN